MSDHMIIGGLAGLVFLCFVGAIALVAVAVSGFCSWVDKHQERAALEEYEEIGRQLTAQLERGRNE